MESVTAKIHREPGEIETPGIATDHGVPLEHGHRERVAPRELERGPQARRTRAENDNRHPGAAHAVGSESTSGATVSTLKERSIAPLCSAIRRTTASATMPISIS